MSRLEQLRNMLNEDPQDAFLRYAFALEHAAGGKRTEAIRIAEELLRDQPEYLGAYYQLGQWYEQEGKNEQALRIYHSGAALAKTLGNKKALGEINEAIWMLED